MLDVVYMPAAKNYLKKVKDKNFKRKFSDAVLAIRKDPRVGDPKRGDLAGYMGYDIYYNKTNYELAYNVVEDEKGEAVVIILAGTRQNFYEELKNYLKTL